MACVKVFVVGDGPNDHQHQRVREEDLIEQQHQVVVDSDEMVHLEYDQGVVGHEQPSDVHHQVVNIIPKCVV
jgi:hypothetical protein